MKGGTHYRLHAGQLVVRDDDDFRPIVGELEALATSEGGPFGETDAGHILMEIAHCAYLDWFYCDLCQTGQCAQHRLVDQVVSYALAHTPVSPIRLDPDGKVRRYLPDPNRPVVK